MFNVLTSLKYKEDVNYSNHYYIKNAYLNLKEVNKIEFYFFLPLDFHFYIKSEVFDLKKV